MKSIRINIRALTFDGKTPFPSSGRIIHNLTSDSHDLIGQTSGPLASLGVLSMRDLVANDLIAATDHVYVSAVGHSGQSGASSFVVHSRCPAMGQRVATSPTREGDPSAGTGQVGPFALAAKDELVLTSNARGEQIVTIELLVGTAVEVERRLDRCEHSSIKLDDFALPDDNTDLDATTTAHGLLPKLSGSTSQYLRGDGTWASVNIGPKTVYELDWTAEPSSGAVSDGTVSVDGNDWTVVNSARASSFQILNGSGLQIESLAGTNWDLDNGTEFGSTAPYIHCPLETLAAECAQYGSRIRIWSYFPEYSIPSTGNQVVAGIGVASGTGYSASTYAAQLQNWTNDGPGYKYGSVEGVGVQATTAENVIVFDSREDGIFHVYHGQWSGGWPAFEGLNYAGRVIIPNATTTALFRCPAASLLIGVATNGTTGAPSCTLARTRIQIG